ncbi:MAG: response regulator [Cyanobacteria bacterium RM1_2_2]|nr:response regulator [Cyanobacteria bacterium RM1_2_2]
MTSPFQVLIADDDHAIRLHISRQLQRYGYAVAVAKNGQKRCLSFSLSRLIWYCSML